jgi:hypothetical protein
VCGLTRVRSARGWVIVMAVLLHVIRPGRLCGGAGQAGWRSQRLIRLRDSTVATITSAGQ